MCLWCELTSFSVLEHILLFSFVQWSEVVKKKCFFWCDNVIRKYIHKRKNINNFFTWSFFGLLIGCVVLFWRSFHFHSVFHSFIFILLFSFFFIIIIIWLIFLNSYFPDFLQSVLVLYFYTCYQLTWLKTEMELKFKFSTTTSFIFHCAPLKITLCTARQQIFHLHTRYLL